jgi:hypothetical protein
VGRLLVALGPGTGVPPSELVAAWDSDAEARALGKATLDAPVRGVFLPDVVSLVVIPLLVNVGSTAAYDLVRRAVAKARSNRPDQPDLELIEITGSEGDRIMVLRVRGERQ